MTNWAGNLWRWLHSTLGRSLTGIGALVTITWFLWPNKYWRVEPSALAALVAALVTWLVSLTPDRWRFSSQHDRGVLQKFGTLISDVEKTHLREILPRGLSWQLK